ncbi:MAG: PTS mannitol transporter subunit IIBC, partial [Clostridium sp.]
SAAVQRIIYACDAGMGSSVMGESIMKTKLQKAMLNIEVMHSSVATLCETARTGDLIVTTKPLEARVKNVLETNGKKNAVYAVNNLLNSEAYDRLVDSLKKSE